MYAEFDKLMRDIVESVIFNVFSQNEILLPKMNFSQENNHSSPEILTENDRQYINEEIEKACSDASSTNKTKSLFCSIKYYFVGNVKTALKEKGLSLPLPCFKPVVEIYTQSPDANWVSKAQVDFDKFSLYETPQVFSFEVNPDGKTSCCFW
ncbi:MAG: hypothetical protein HC848_09820 [Limnobacter sp.]|nr:hypothetical protein [Limnobacter sp.]